MKRKWTDEQLIEAVKNSTYWQEISEKVGYRVRIASRDVMNTLGRNIRELNLDTSHLLQRPNTNNWGNLNRKQYSYAEKIFSQALLECGVTTTAQYKIPGSKRNFEIDFAIVGKRIAFEANGNQHYKGGKLAPYYQERHDYLNSLGWVVHEIQYHECINLERAKKVIMKCLENDRIEYSTDPQIIIYSEEKKAQKQLLDESISILEENIDILRMSNQFKNAVIDNDFSVFFSNLRFVSAKETETYLNYRRVDRPSKEKLLEMVWTTPIMTIGKEFGLSGNSIKKWCKSYGIPHPPLGYWARKHKDKSAIKSKMFTQYGISVMKNINE